MLMRRTKASLWVITATAMTVVTLFLLPFTPKVAVHTAEIGRGNLVESVLLEGIASYRDHKPLVSYQAGRVSAVYVQKGQAVTAGQLLFSMDTTAEQEALATIANARYLQEQQLETYGQALAAAWVQSAWEMEKTETELRASIASKQIRAEANGVIGGVYAQEGDYVAALSVLGEVRGDGMAVTAVNRVADASDISVGALASITTSAGESVGVAQLCAVGAPTLNEQTAQYVQQLTFEPVTDVAIENGEQLTLRLLIGATENVPIVPISAVGSGGKLWVVRSGKAEPVHVDVSKRNDQYVCVPEELVGERIILAPDEYALSVGCPVKEAKRR